MMPWKRSEPLYIFHTEIRITKGNFAFSIQQKFNEPGNHISHMSKNEIFMELPLS